MGIEIMLNPRGKMRQSSESAYGETDDGLQKANALENRFLRESSSDLYEEPLNPEIANVGIFNDENNVVIHKDTALCILSKASHEDNEVTEKKDAELTRNEDELYGANAWGETDDNLPVW